jgi:hypothetical protein
MILHIIHCHLCSFFKKNCPWYPYTLFTSRVFLFRLFSFSLCLFQASDFFFFTYGSFRHLVELLGRGSVQRQGLYLHRTTQHRETQTHIHALSTIRTCNPNVRAAEDSTCLRPHGYWDQPLQEFSKNKYYHRFQVEVNTLPPSSRWNLTSHYYHFFIFKWHITQVIANLPANLRHQIILLTLLSSETFGYS